MIKTETVKEMSESVWVSAFRVFSMQVREINISKHSVTRDYYFTDAFEYNTFFRTRRNILIFKGFSVWICSFWVETSFFVDLFPTFCKYFRSLHQGEKQLDIEYQVASLSDKVNWNVYETLETNS